MHSWRMEFQTAALLDPWARPLTHGGSVLGSLCFGWINANAWDWDKSCFSIDLMILTWRAKMLKRHESENTTLCYVRVIRVKAAVCLSLIYLCYCYCCLVQATSLKIWFILTNLHTGSEIDPWPRKCRKLLFYVYVLYLHILRWII